MNRKYFISISAQAVAALAIPSMLRAQTKDKKIKAVAFDAFTLFDTKPVAAAAEQGFPGKGPMLMNLWRTRQFEYTWLRSLSHTYADFGSITKDALKYAAAALQLDLTAEKESAIMQTFAGIKFTNDAMETLHLLKGMSLKLAILSNATQTLLQHAISNSDADGLFDFVLSTDSIKTYKPDPAAYRLGTNAFRLEKKEILFVAFGGWDAAGAKAFGYPVVWINAAGNPAEELGFKPDFVCTTITALPDYLKTKNKS